VKGISPQGPRATVQIEQYLFGSVAQLTSCSSPAATPSRLTSGILPHASLARRKPTVKTCVDNTAKLRPQASVLALKAAGASQLVEPASTTPRSYGRWHRPWHYGHVHATHNERCRGKRPVHHDQVHAWRLGIGLGTTIQHLRRTTSGAAGNGLGPAMKYLRRTTSAAANNGLSTTITPPCSAASFKENSEPNTGTSSSVRLCMGPELARCVHRWP
jgi:hypothetical protein